MVGLPTPSPHTLYGPGLHKGVPQNGIAHWQGHYILKSMDNIQTSEVQFLHADSLHT
jgi:hypothetical protein